MGSPVHIIAVIDHDFRVFESLQNLLASFGYKAETYLSAESCFRSIFIGRFRIILSHRRGVAATR
jgi:FixJ family two-component response regulator